MDRKTDLRLWAVLFWLAVWQIAAMALAAVYPHGELLLASPADVLLRLGQLAVTAAFCRTDRRLLEMARVFRVPFGRRLRGIYLPQVMPYFRTAVSLGLGLCWKAGAAAEIIGLPAGSMGERLYTAKVYFQTADLFAWTVTIVAVSVAFERLFLALVDRLMGKAGL